MYMYYIYVLYYIYSCRVSRVKHELFIVEEISTDCESEEKVVCGVFFVVVIVVKSLKACLVALQSINQSINESMNQSIEAL